MVLISTGAYFLYKHIKDKKKRRQAQNSSVSQQHHGSDKAIVLSRDSSSSSPTETEYHHYGDPVATELPGQHEIPELPSDNSPDFRPPQEVSAEATHAMCVSRPGIVELPADNQPMELSTDSQFVDASRGGYRASTLASNPPVEMPTDTYR
ncbi:hypothetical protein F5Y15DRAFT_413927 [Xylariaceae sp. FL0016]|nr:hypothetical protein F5Y15DRAFT_413927 [Xylariaceae sp. FL0016]